MIHFLRKIRHSQIQGENMKKYILYAIGEITLVVIGILIALQIDDWNTNRINQIELTDNMQSIKLDLETDVNSISERLNGGDYSITYYSKLLKEATNLKDAELFVRRLSGSFAPLNSAGYNMSISNNKLNLIKIASLKTSLISYYEKDYKDFVLMQNILYQEQHFGNQRDKLCHNL